MLEYEWIVFLGVVTGVLSRTMVPYWQKLREDPNLKFDPTFALSALFAGFLAFLSYEVINPDLSPLKLFLAAWGHGYLLDSLINRAKGKRR